MADQCLPSDGMDIFFVQDKNGAYIGSTLLLGFEGRQLRLKL
jgi:hypothetical protein